MDNLFRWTCNRARKTLRVRNALNVQKKNHSYLCLLLCLLFKMRSTFICLKIGFAINILAPSFAFGSYAALPGEVPWCVPLYIHNGFGTHVVLCRLGNNLAGQYKRGGFSGAIAASMYRSKAWAVCFNSFFFFFVSLILYHVYWHGDRSRRWGLSWCCISIAIRSYVHTYITIAK